jgi:soluble lytic murein transglycosylase-like protein
MDKNTLAIFVILMLIAFGLTFFVSGGVEAADYTDTEEFKNKIRRIESWRDLVNEVQLEENYSFDTDKILAIIAQESGGLPWITSNDKHQSVGLMQCTPAPWTTTAARLKIPKINIQCGLWILDNAMRAANGNWREALRYYNCGVSRANEWANCGAYYADRVLNFWLPYFDRPEPIGQNWELRFVYRWKGMKCQKD